MSSEKRRTARVQGGWSSCPKPSAASTDSSTTAAVHTQPFDKKFVFEKVPEVRNCVPWTRLAGADTAAWKDKTDNRQDNNTDMAKPKLIAFDLDYTLWPFWVDTHVDPPFRKRDGRIFDAHNREVKPYPEVPKVLERLKSEGYEMAVASRTSCTSEARDLIRLFDWEKYFSHKEIYPGSKKTHFAKFKQATGLNYTEMLFFDDEHRNYVDLTPLGVTMIEIDDRIGVTEEVIKHGFEIFASKHKSLHSKSS